MRAVHLFEAWVGQYSVYGFNNASTEVDAFKNPSRSEFMRLIKEARYHDLRGLILKDKSLIVWDAGLTTHGDMQKHFHDAYSIYLILKPDSLVLSDINYEANEGDDYETYPYASSLAWMVSEVQSCPTLQHIYRGQEIIGVDNDTGESYVLSDEWLKRKCKPKA